MVKGPRIRIGVTGHRVIERDFEDRLIPAIHRVLGRVRDRIRAADLAPPSFTALSLLAEGADRLVAREVLTTPGGALEVPLPLAEEEYLRDFASHESRQEFQRLLARAYRVIPPSEEFARPEAYRQAGRYVLQHSQVLIAVWNGHGGPRSSKRGGTSEIVRMARALAMPIYWIRVNGRMGITEEHTAKLDDWSRA